MVHEHRFIFFKLVRYIRRHLSVYDKHFDLDAVRYLYLFGWDKSERQFDVSFEYDDLFLAEHGKRM